MCGSVLVWFGLVGISKNKNKGLYLGSNNELSRSLVNWLSDRFFREKEYNNGLQAEYH